MALRSTALIVLSVSTFGLGKVLAAPTVAASAIQPSSKQVNSPVSKAYILGPGDKLRIELFNIPELSGTFSIGPDGTIYLPRLRALYVEGLTVEELQYFLTDQYKTYVKDPEVYVSPVTFRPVRVYVGGEIIRPGYYVLSGGDVLDDQLSIDDLPETIGRNELKRRSNSRSAINDVSTIQGVTTVQSAFRWPTLFDALRAAQGVTPYSKLDEVFITRNQPLSSGGGKVRARVDFWQLVKNGNDSVNIRLFDGDVINVSRSPTIMRDQLLAASRTNLSPDFVEVFVSGRVKEPGPQTVPQGATLNQAIASAGGPKLLRGSIEFLRFNPDGTTDRRRFSYNSSAETNDFKNPVLMTGDVIRVNDSLISASVELLNEVTGPAVGIYSVYSLFKP